ncbi:cytochrome P450 2H2-like isoform X2 [Dermacentor albipictus]|uniref:cytochrome P450 2H2-like isoform X2 n=1 Tax=Dermacentor albipictus TaxID=60249 RepID=UPI0038FC721A
MDALDFGTSMCVVVITSLLAALLATLLRHSAKDRSHRTPPGPVYWPVLGKLNFSSPSISLKQSVQWSKKYGPIVGLKQGSVDVVILNDNEQIKDILSRPEVQDRPTTWGLSSAQKGFSTFSGQQWKENRDFSMRALAKLGLGSEVMRQHIQFEARHLADTLASHHGHPVSSFVYGHRSHINSICRFLLGYRYDLDDPHFASLQEALSGFRLQTAAAPIEHRAAWLRRVLIEPLWPASISAKRRHNISTINSVVSELVQTNEDTKNSGRTKSYIDLYLEKIREAETHKNQYFTDNLVGNMVDILMGAATSGNFYLHWHLLNLASHADTLQAELQREIDSVVGSDRLPSWEDHTSMPLTIATIWEMFRWKLATPFNIPRAVGADTKMGDYDVRKGTVVSPNLMTAHRDHKLWKNPDEFDPTRFLNPDGTATTKRPDGLLSFAVGRRVCPGENMAMVEIFLYLTTLLHQFRILHENEKPVIITPFGPSPELRETKLRFLQRNH